MYLPTIQLNQDAFDALPVSNSGAYDQETCRYLSGSGDREQWILIDRRIKKYGAAVIEIGERSLPIEEIVDEEKSRRDMTSIEVMRREFFGTGGAGPLPPIRRKTLKINRNQPCPCGSGKKHKKCCLNATA